MDTFDDSRCVSAFSLGMTGFSLPSAFCSDLCPSTSQASQLLQNVLDGEIHSGRKRNESDGQNHMDDPNISKDFSPDSVPSSNQNSNSAPLYQYHGLAATQTQTQHNDGGNGENEGSQKENINAAVKSGEVRFNTAPANGSASAIPHAASSKNSSKTPNVEQSSHSPSCATLTKVCSQSPTPGSL